MITEATTGAVAAKPCPRSRRTDRRFPPELTCIAGSGCRAIIAPPPEIVADRLKILSGHRVTSASAKRRAPSCSLTYGASFVIQQPNPTKTTDSPMITQSTVSTMVMRFFFQWPPLRHGKACANPEINSGQRKAAMSQTKVHRRALQALASKARGD
jgi:hypothetical protein